MKTAILLLLLAVPALAKTYKVGTVTPHRYSSASTTVDCSGSPYSATCSAYDTTATGAIYDMIFADGSTRTVEHCSFTKDPLKSIGGATRIEYRVYKRWGITYIGVLDSNGKEGTYIFAGSQRAPKPYGPAPVRVSVP